MHCRAAFIATYFTLGYLLFSVHPTALHWLLWGSSYKAALTASLCPRRPQRQCCRTKCIRRNISFRGEKKEKKELKKARVRSAPDGSENDFWSKFHFIRMQTTHLVDQWLHPHSQEGRRVQHRRLSKPHPGFAGDPTNIVKIFINVIIVNIITNHYNMITWRPWYWSYRRSFLDWGAGWYFPCWMECWKKGK